MSFDNGTLETIEFFCLDYNIFDFDTFRSVGEDSSNPMVRDWYNRVLDSHEDARAVLGCIARARGRYKC